ncbi:MAG: hypothetical protein WDN01_16845 [Rhizomicrobium sp.]
MSGRQDSGLGAFFVHEARQAVQDIRQKLFEEAWFGRVVTAAPVMEVEKERSPEDRRTVHDGLGERRSAFDEAWGKGMHPSHAEERQLTREQDFER